MSTEEELSVDVAAGTSCSTDPASSSASSTREPISRRRAAFRPPQVSKPASLPAPVPQTSASSQAITVASNDGQHAQGQPLSAALPPANLSEAPPSNEDLQKKKGKMWSHEEIMLYYEALKQCGKDFDAIARYIGKKKVGKEREQIRNYYYNSVKQIRTISNLDIDARFPELCRDAKELFLAINGCEWRKKTLSHKYVPERLRELLLDGSTIIRSKKRTLQVKTPVCPALSKYFQLHRRVEKSKLPNDVIIQLTPTTSNDRAYVISCEQNPFVRLRVPIDLSISEIYKILQKKWITPLDRAAKVSDNGLKATLRPSAQISVGNVVLVETAVESQVVSLNRLSEELQIIAKARSAQDANVPYSTVTSYSAITPHPFILDEKLLRDGLTLENVKDASVVELYCLCGMTPEIKLLYSLEINKQKPSLTVWNIFTSLLTREYGDAISTCREEENRKRNSESMNGIVEEEEPPAKIYAKTMRKPSSSSQKSTPISIRPRSVAKRQEQPSAEMQALCDKLIPPKRAEDRPLPAGRRCIDVIADEQDKLRRQIDMLQAKKSAARSAGARARTPKAVIANKVPRSAYVPTIYKPEDHRILAQSQRLTEPAQSVTASASQPSTSTSIQVAQVTEKVVDFSEMNTADSRSHFLSSLKTPEKSIPKKDVIIQSAEKQSSELLTLELFGEISRSPQASRYSTRAKNKSRNEQMEQLFGELSMTPTKGFSQIASGLSSDSIQGCVDTAMHEMMSQDSVDFLKSFQPLVDTFGKDK